MNQSLIQKFRDDLDEKTIDRVNNVINIIVNANNELMIGMLPNLTSGIQNRFDIRSGVGTQFRYVVGTTNLDDTSWYWAVDATGGASNANLPASAKEGEMFMVCRVNSTGGNVTIVPSGGDSIVGGGTVLSSYGAVWRGIYNGTGLWFPW